MMYVCVHNTHTHVYVHIHTYMHACMYVYKHNYDGVKCEYETNLIKLLHSIFWLTFPLLVRRYSYVQTFRNCSSRISYRQPVIIPVAQTTALKHRSTDRTQPVLNLHILLDTLNFTVLPLC